MGGLKQMKICTNCRRENQSDARFCQFCGHALHEAQQQTDPHHISNKNENNTSERVIFAVLGWIFNALALFFIPILFGGIGIVFGFLHRKYQKTHGTIIMIAGVICTIVGMIIGAVVTAILLA